MSRQIHHILTISLLALLQVVTVACGEYLDFDTGDIKIAGSMSLPRKVFPMVVGDSYVIPVTFTPDSVDVATVFWQSDDKTIALFRNDTLIAVGEGITHMIACATIDRLRDTCWVEVLPAFYTPSSDYPYDMVVYASVNLHGTPLTKEMDGNVIIAAYVDNDLRGIGQMMESNGRQYLQLRIWSPYTDAEQISLRCYYRGQARIELFADTIPFTDGQMLGTLSNLYPLVLDERYREYIPPINFDDSNPLIEIPDTTHVEIVD